MSYSDSDSSSYGGGGDQRNFLEITRDRLLHEMIGSTKKGDSKLTWKELVEKLNKGELPKEDYPCMNDPSPSFHNTSNPTSVTAGTVAHSIRSRRTPTWARPRNSEDGYSSDSVLRQASSSDLKKMGSRIFVFIVGGATRSELRVCHKLTTKLNREVILGSSSLDDPQVIITKMKLLTAHELSLDDLQI